MNKVLKSLVVGGLGLMMLPGMVKADMNGQETLGNYSSNATLNKIDNGNYYELAIQWGNLSYDYVKQDNDSYAWVPVAVEDEYGNSESQNFIEVINLSSAEVAVSIDWKPSVTGVTASYESDLINFDNLDCIADNSDAATWWWGGSDDNYQPLIEYSSTEGTKYYTDSSCTTEVTDGVPYEMGKYYYKAPSSIVSNEVSVVLPTSGYVEDRHFYSDVRWVIDLAGGDYENVKTVYNTDEKIIGSFTITIEDLEGLDN